MRLMERSVVAISPWAADAPDMPLDVPVQVIPRRLGAAGRMVSNTTFDVLMVLYRTQGPETAQDFALGHMDAAARLFRAIDRPSTGTQATLNQERN